MKLINSPKVRAELEFSPNDVKRLQEWLWLHGIRIEIDGTMGPATRAALAEFRRQHGLVGSDLDDDLVAALTLPMRRALELGAGWRPFGIGEALVRIAQMHLALGAREAPGKNLGPWVRIYGEEGEPWCAAFVSFVLRQAAEIAGIDMPIRGSADCDALVGQARRVGRLVVSRSTDGLAPGDAFVAYRDLPVGGKDYCHTGFIERVEFDHLVTIEGNTNPAGGREGYEVERRIRSFDRKDFIRLG